MAINIVRVSGTVGTSQVIAVVTNKKINDVCEILNKWAIANFGEYASVEYIESYQVPTISLTDLNVDRLLCLDELI
ncbi:hypothetical protein [Escherichia phage phiWec190]|jgi:hypothetical protein|uniref:Uncharacterized protein n=4 Tax=Phapecoctavirus TaxID=2733124 RepID=A0A6B9WXR6_9CAUD|nr:hypothetical protein [Escherichia coli]YP_009985060.1 hypothetical protein JR319_gp122 [Escherichia phage vB_EcoM-Ro121c4YLVW]YP_009986243.1 hypothetical protein JR324_gp123 [Escherichia phage nieznany]YP_009986415.1 hypothetical protein JR325_gp039 [Escherichia phage tuntematon]AXA27792.1 hypothetical protein vBEcoMRo121lw_00268 [Escherichia phage vB_EcoM-Ro121lw]WIL78309.1 hypothetical protein NWUPM3A1_249 [Escherichia phage vB_EcoM_3A1_SA_NWU]WIL78797.1 hypothetical protein NWUPM10C3_25